MLPYKFLRLPHEQQIGGGLNENSIIRLQGRTFENPKGFSLRLACGQDIKDDIPFMMRWDVGSDKIVVTTQDSSAWTKCGDTQFKSDYFQPATAFDFTIETSIDCFQINLGGLQLEYEHKLPFHTIRYIMVDGDINLQDISINGISVNEDQNRIPVARDLPERKTATVIRVKGFPVRAKPHRMAIDFTSGIVGNLEFHFNPRFHEQVLVRNTMIQNQWLEEERQLQTPFPFVYGLGFELHFSIEDDFIFVRLNGNYLCKYQRRDGRQRINKMHVYGSVVITEAEVL